MHIFRWNLKMKLGVGFGILILVILILGLNTVQSMRQIQREAILLGERYVPEVRIARDIELYVQQTMYQIRGYELTENVAFLKEGRASLTTARQAVQEAKTLAGQAQAFDNAVMASETMLIQYEALMVATEKQTQQMSSSRDVLEEMAKMYMNNCYDLLHIQNASLQAETAAAGAAETFTRNLAIQDLIAKLIAVGEATHVMTLQAYSQRNLQLIRDVQTSFDGIEELLTELVDLIYEAKNIKALNTIRATVRIYRKRMQEVLLNWETIQKLDAQRNQIAADVLARTRETVTEAMQETKIIADQTIQLLALNLRTLILGSFVAIAISIGATLLITRSIVRPLTKSVEFARAIADGNLAARIDVRQDDEIGVLVNALSVMRLKIQAVLQEMHGLIEAVQAGNLSARGNVQAFGGGWRELVKGVNNLIEEFVAPITMASTYLEQIARGDIPAPITEASQGDFNTINNHLNMLIDATNKVTGLAQAIGGGDLHVEVTPRSERDELMKTLREMMLYLQDIAQIAEKIARKDLQVDVQPRSAQDVLSHSLHRMVTNLRAMMDANAQSLTAIQQQNWLRTGQAEIGNIMRGEQDVVTLAKNLLDYLVHYLNGEIGTLYLFDPQPEHEHLYLVASYAYQTRERVGNTLRLGEGLAGQAALEKITLVYHEIPADYLPLATEFGLSAPQQVIASPFLFGAELKGVIEIGTRAAFLDAQVDFLKQASENIAIAFHSAQARASMQKMLNERASWSERRGQ